MDGQGMAWILLITYTCLLVYNVGFCYWAFEFDTLNSTNSSTTPTMETTTYSSYPTTQTDAYPEDSNYNDSGRFKREADYLDNADSPDYDYRKQNYNDHPETYIYISCGTSAIVTLVVVFAGFCSRTVFGTTMPMHTSLFMVALHLGTLITVLHRKNLVDNIWIIIGSNIGAVILNALQVLLSLFHLKRQSLPLIAFNFNKLLSLNGLSLVIRTVLSAVALRSFFCSNFWSGSSNPSCSEEPCLPTQYYMGNAFFCAITCLVALLINAKLAFSFTFGSTHHIWATGVTVLLACGYAAMSVMVSPLYTSSKYTAQFSTEPMIYAITCTVIHFVHFIFMCFLEHLYTNVIELLRIVTTRTQDGTCFLTFGRLVRDENDQVVHRAFWRNTALLVFSLFAIVLGAISLSQHGGWYNSLLLAVAASLFSRSAVMTTSEILTAKPDPTTILQKLFFLILEGMATLVALIASSVDNGGLAIAASAILLMAYIILAIHVVNSPFIKDMLEKLLPSQPILISTPIEDDIPSGSRPHQSEVHVGGDGDGDNNANVVLQPDTE